MFYVFHPLVYTKEKMNIYVCVFLLPFVVLMWDLSHVLLVSYVPPKERHLRESNRDKPMLNLWCLGYQCFSHAYVVSKNNFNFFLIFFSLFLTFFYFFPNFSDLPFYVLDVWYTVLDKIIRSDNTRLILSIVW